MATSEKSDGSKDKQAKLKQQMLNLEDKENRWTYFTFFFFFQEYFFSYCLRYQSITIAKKRLLMLYCFEFFSHLLFARYRQCMLQ